MNAQQVLVLYPEEVSFLDAVRFQDWTPLEQSVFVNAFLNTRTVSPPAPELCAPSVGAVPSLTPPNSLLPPLRPPLDVYTERSEADA